jgi:flagellar basal-body rod protein FlgC
MGLFDAIDASGSGLSVERLRMDVTAENLANAQTTGYRRKDVVVQQAGAGVGGPASFEAALSKARGGSGVQVAGVVEDTSPGRRIYDPGHPDADAQGYVTLPNVSSVTEMVDLISASRAYEADVTAMQTAKQMFTRTLDILR